MLRMFVVCFMIAFGAVVVACGVNGGAWDSPVWLIAECVVAAAIGALIWQRLAPLLQPATDEFEFDVVDEDEEE